VSRGGETVCKAEGRVSNCLQGFCQCVWREVGPAKHGAGGQPGESAMKGMEEDSM
jgi:hypothetical protein